MEEFIHELSTNSLYDMMNWTGFLRRGEIALVIIDPQNDVLEESGNLSFWGVWEHAKENDSVEKIKQLVAACRKIEIPVFWIRAVRLAGGKDVFPATFGAAMMGLIRGAIPNALMEGTWDVDIVDELKDVIEPKDIIIDKGGMSAFEGTRLQRYLIELGIKTLLVCGFLTDVCVESTSRTAFDRGYLTILVGDACATRSEELHRGALERHEWLVGPVVTTTRLTELFDAL
jgi:nicotinamidase-related amidase